MHGLTVHVPCMADSHIDQDDWQAHPLMHQKIREILEPGATILELGSGRGTALLAEDYRVLSIEHDKKWMIYRDHPNILQIHAPIQQDNWYDPITIPMVLSPYRYDLLIIDGPPGQYGRSKFLKHTDLFDLSVHIIIDDTNRPEEMALASQLSGITGRKLEFFHCPDGRSFGLIRKKEDGEQRRANKRDRDISE